MSERTLLLDCVVMTNRFPWSDLVLDGYGEKSGSRNVRHRGLVLLRTAKSRIDRVAAEEHERLPPENLGCIIGAADLIRVEGDFGEYTYTFGRVGRFRRPVEFNPHGPVRWARIKLSRSLRAAVREVGLGDLL